MPSSLRLFFKDLTSGRVIPIRGKRPQETGTSASHPCLPATDSPKNVLYTKSGLSEAGDVIQLVSPMVQAAAAAIPVAGSPLKAAVDGLLYIIQIIDIKNRNKADLDNLALRVRGLFDILSEEPEPRDEEEARRRTALTERLNDTSRKLTGMQGHRGFKFAYSSVTKDIAACKTDVNDFLLEYGIHKQVVTHQMLSQLLVSPRDCAILIDAVGHEHKVSLEYCTSLQQLKNMVAVLLTPERTGASVQRRYFESGKFDLCIDDGKRVVQLSSGSNEWPNMEAGTKIVMRVIFEQAKIFSATYTCHLCGTPNKISPPIAFEEWVTDGSVDCHACKGRFQISLQQKRRGAIQSDVGNDLLDTETRHCIRNFRVTQIRDVAGRDIDAAAREIGASQQSRSNVRRLATSYQTFRDDSCEERDDELENVEDRSLYEDKFSSEDEAEGSESGGSWMSAESQLDLQQDEGWREYGGEE